MEKIMPFAVVVDDETVQLEMLSGLISKTGLIPHGFCSAEDALAYMTTRLNENKGEADALPAIIISDICLPGIDGWRFCRLLHAEEYKCFNNIPVILVSASMLGQESEYITANSHADAFITAPFNGKHILAKVKSVLERRRQHKSVKQVLIVEDSPALARGLKKAYENTNYTCQIAHSLATAQQAIANVDYDVAVIDYYLPDGLGDVLLENLQVQSPYCVCLMITTDPNPDLALAWLKKGASFYLRKPFSGKYLVKMSEKALREKDMLRMNEALDKRDDELKRIYVAIEYVSDAIGMSSPEGLHFYHNKAFEKLFGYTISELTNMMPLAMFLYPSDHRRVFNSIMSGKAWQGEVKMIAKDGRHIDVFLRANCVRDENGNIKTFVGVHDDITERRRLQKTLLNVTAVERERLRRDLHDSVCQQITAIGFLAKNICNIAGAENNSVQHAAKNISKITRDVMKQLDGIISGLALIENQMDAFYEALLILAHYVNAVFDINCKVMFQREDMKEMSSVDQLFLIVREAIMNAVKHAGCKNIKLTYTVVSFRHLFEILDDGCGFMADECNLTKGNGIDIMKARAQMIGVSLQWIATDNAGTKVICSWT